MEEETRKSGMISKNMRLTKICIDYRYFFKEIFLIIYLKTETREVLFSVTQSKTQKDKTYKKKLLEQTLTYFELIRCPNKLLIYKAQILNSLENFNKIYEN